ncbi:MAG: hypothetical protein JNM75_12245 [Rhodospirillales bacterium]|nr:hypothetical protein [Rhodospirillales bacterium]
MNDVLERVKKSSDGTVLGFLAVGRCQKSQRVSRGIFSVVGNGPAAWPAVCRRNQRIAPASRAKVRRAASGYDRMSLPEFMREGLPFLLAMLVAPVAVTGVPFPPLASSTDRGVAVLSFRLPKNGRLIRSASEG